MSSPNNSAPPSAPGGQGGQGGQGGGGGGQAGASPINLSPPTVVTGITPPRVTQIALVTILERWFNCRAGGYCPYLEIILARYHWDIDAAQGYLMLQRRRGNENDYRRVGNDAPDDSTAVDNILQAAQGAAQVTARVNLTGLGDFEFPLAQPGPVPNVITGIAVATYQNRSR